MNNSNSGLTQCVFSSTWNFSKWQKYTTETFDWIPFAYRWASQCFMKNVIFNLWEWLKIDNMFQMWILFVFVSEKCRNHYEWKTRPPTLESWQFDGVPLIELITIIENADWSSIFGVEFIYWIIHEVIFNSFLIKNVSLCDSFHLEPETN